MAKPISILIVDDSEQDALLMENELLRSGFVVESTRVDSKDAYLKALDSGVWDAILCDSSMPRFDGMTALRLLRQSELDIPFIFVSETMDEDFAVDLMKAGARDYLMKDNLKRLVPAVERELRAAALQRKHRFAEETLKRYQILYESAHDIILFVRKEDGQILEANRAAETIYGYSRDELLSLTIRDLREKGTLADVSEQMVKADAEGIFFETVHRRKDGSCFPVEVSSMGTSKGGTRVLLSIIRDITDRKQAEIALRDSEERLRILFEYAPDAYYLSDLKGNFVDGNRAAEQLTGYRRDELIGKNFFSLDLLPLSEMARASHLILKNAMGLSTGPDEYTLCTKQRGTVSLEIRTHPVEINGHTLVLGIARDITERKQSEENRRLQASALEAAANSIVITDSAGTILWVNQSFTRMTGYGAEEVIGKNPRILKSGVQEDSVYQDLWKTVLSGKVWQGHIVNRRKDGSLYTEEMTITPVLDERGKVKNFVAVKQDITERMRAQETLRNSEKKYKDIVEFAPVGIYQSTREGTILTANGSIAKILGYDSPHELLGTDITELYVHKEEREALIRKNAPVGWGKSIELEWRKKDGTPLWIQLDAHAVKDESGSIKYFEGFVLDISKRRTAEDAIRESEIRFRSVWDRSADGMRLTDKDGRIIDVNAAYCRIVKMSRVQLLGNIFSIVYKPEGEQRDLTEYHKRFDSGDVLSHLQASVTLWNNEVLHLEISSSIIDIVDHRRMFLSIFHDVSERKQTEKENALLAHTVRSSKDCISVADLEDKILFVNDAFLSTYGYLENELIGQPISMLWSPTASADDFKDVLAGTLRGGWHGELMNKRKDGSEFPIELWTSPVSDERGSPVAFVGVARDITERKRSEEALKLFRTLIDRSNDAIEVVDPKTGAFLDVNDQGCQDLGYTREELLSLTVSDIDPSVDNAVLVSRGHEIKTRGALIWESFHRRKDGSTFPVEINSRYVQLNQEYIITVVRDISERRRLEKQTKALSTLSHELSSISTREAASDLIVATADELIGWDACTLDLYSSETDTVHSVLAIDLMDGQRRHTPPIHNDRPPTERMRRVLEEGPWLILREEGEGMPTGVVPFGDVNRPSASLMIVPIRYDTEVIGILSIQSYSHHRYTEGDLQILQGLADYCGATLERIRSQEDLALQTSRFRQLFENSPFGIVLVDPNDCVVDINQAFTQIFGYALEEMKGKALNELIVPSDRMAEGSSLSQKTLQGQTVQSETVRKRKDGSPLEVALTGYPIVIGGTAVGICGIYVDITAQKRMQEQLFQAQKMESIGTLASGIAHDFNNILGIILGHLGLLERIRGDEVQFKESVVAVSNAVDRGASLVRQILTFARKTETELEPVSINNAIKELAKMLRETFPKTITLELKLEKTIPVVSMDPTQLHQTLLNLCVNARDAMNGTGSLVLTTQLVSGRKISSRFPRATAGHYIRLSVADTGIGMNEETKRHIFEPFFTTKVQGKGTGLGLAVVYGALQAHSGFVDVETSPGAGTAFHLYFPVPDGILTVREKNPEQEQDLPRGTEKILLVEDEDVLRSLLAKFLQIQGYSVIEASDGEEAVRRFSEHAHEIALVLSDLGLPKLSGWDAYKLMQRINPQVRAVLASGYVAPGEKSEMLKSGVKQFIYKPYQINEVLKAIREALKQ